jgi:putative transposase
MPRVRRRFDAKFKSRVALEAIRGLKAISEIAKQFKVHPNQVTLWKKQLLDGAELYEQIGRMKVELEWLKKKVAENS